MSLLDTPIGVASGMTVHLPHQNSDGLNRRATSIHRTSCHFLLPPRRDVLYICMLTSFHRTSSWTWVFSLLQPKNKHLKTLSFSVSTLQSSGDVISSHSTSAFQQCLYRSNLSLLHSYSIFYSISSVHLSKSAQWTRPWGKKVLSLLNYKEKKSSALYAVKPS